MVGMAIFPKCKEFPAWWVMEVAWVTADGKFGFGWWPTENGGSERWLWGVELLLDAPRTQDDS